MKADAESTPRWNNTSCLTLTVQVLLSARLSMRPVMNGASFASFRTFLSHKWEVICSTTIHKLASAAPQSRRAYAVVPRSKNSPPTSGNCSSIFPLFLKLEPARTTPTFSALRVRLPLMPKLFVNEQDCEICSRQHSRHWRCEQTSNPSRAIASQ